MKTDNGKKLTGLVGMAMKAGRLTVGCERICDAIRSGTPRIVVVIMASDAAENTVKRIVNCCTYYGTDYMKQGDPENGFPLTSVELGHAIGKTGAVSAVGIIDRGFAKAIAKLAEGEIISPEAADPGEQSGESDV